MEDALTLAERLRDAPDLFPWVCLAIICIVAVAQHKRIFAYFDARIEAYSASKQFKAIMIELMRNNTAALESCTEEREKVRLLLTHHEKLSAERDKHIQTVVNRIDANVSKNGRLLELIEDRTYKQ